MDYAIHKLYVHEFAKALTIDFSSPRCDGNGARLFVFPLNYICMNYFVVRSGSCIMYDSFPRGSQVRIGLSMRRGRIHLYPWGRGMDRDDRLE